MFPNKIAAVSRTFSNTPALSHELSARFSEGRFNTDKKLFLTTNKYGD